MVTLNEIANRGNTDKKYGPNTYCSGSAEVPDFPRIPTGVFALDYALGGGFPAGVTSSIYGPPGGGKTLVMSKLAAGAQNICWNCFDYLWDCTCGETRPQRVVIVQLEQFDIEWAQSLGLNIDTTLIAHPGCGEEASDIIIECLRSDDCGVVFLDSLPMMTPLAELEGSALDTQQVALQARLISSTMRKIKQTLIKESKKGHKTTFIATNQIRAKIGGFGFQNEVQAGGYVQKHDWHLTLRMSQLKSTDVNKDTELLNTAKFKASTIALDNKRKVFMLAGAAEFLVGVNDVDVIAKGEIQDIAVMFKYADAGGLIGREPWTFDGVQYDKKQDILDLWSADSESMLSAKKAIVQHFVDRTKGVNQH